MALEENCKPSAEEANKLHKIDQCCQNKDSFSSLQEQLNSPSATTTCCIPGLTDILERHRKNLKQEELEEEERSKILERAEDIRKQKSDTNRYRFIQLSNGIRMILISSPESTSSAAALDIKVGSFSDPSNLQGLSHLCEHVLFTGSEAYPNESYSAFLGERGGTSNACTTCEHTNFHFDIPCKHFEEALKRFVSFFECPLFKESCVQHELEIVQSEHEKNRYNDGWRTNQVERATANENHAFSRFSTGTRQTLDLSESPDRNLKYELYNFFKINYSANLMTVCLLHNCSLDQLESLSKKLFLRIPNKNIPETIWPNNPFKASQMKSKVFIVPIKDIYHVNLTFPMEDFSAFYQSSPQGSVAQLVGYKGPNGLFAHLRQLGYAHHLIASWRSLAKGFSFFMVTVQMTESGERHVDEIVKYVFQYIQLIKESGIPKWFFEEMQFLSEQQFENKEQERAQQYVTNISNWLHLYPPQDVLIGDYIFTKFTPEVIKKVLRYLNPDNVRVTILTKNCRYFASQVEPHFGAEYHVEKIPLDLIKQWRHCGTNNHHQLPKPNDLLDRKMELVSIDSKRHSKNSLPELFLMLDRIRMKAWFKPAIHFKLAKSFVYLKFHCTELAAKNAKSCSLNNLFVFLIRDSLTEYSYCGELAGLFYNIKPFKFGFELSLRGYSDKQHCFLQNILTKVYSLDFVKERFDQVYEVHKKGLESSESDSLKSQAKFLLSSILCPKTFSRRERLTGLKEIEFSDLQHYADLFRVKCSIECMFYGNLTVSQADKMSNIVIDERMKFLEACVEQRKVTVRKNALLEEWFLKNPVERIVMAEEALLADLETISVVTANGNATRNGLQPNEEDDDELNSHENDDHDNTELVKQIEEEEKKKKASVFCYDQELKLPPVNNNNPGHVFIVHNEIQSSSCVLFYLQHKVNVPKNLAVLELFFTLVRQKLISNMKQVVALGYVVGCDIRRMNGTLGFRIIVESQYPLKMVHDTIEQALADLEDYLEEMSEKTLQMAKQALIATKEEVKQRMRDCATILWREVLECSYNFRRLEEETVVLETLNMKHIRKLYRQFVQKSGPERRNLVISFGPDPILNSLEKVECLGLEKVPTLQAQCESFPVLETEVLNKWYQEVFQCHTNQYLAPSLSV